MLVTRLSTLSVVAAAAASLACSGTADQGPAFCTAAYVPAVEVVPVDSITGAPLAAGATGMAQSGQYTDSMGVLPPPLDSVMVGGYPPGTYQVTIAHPGYRQWVRDNIVVQATGPCNGPKTVRFGARLQPAP